MNVKSCYSLATLISISRPHARIDNHLGLWQYLDYNETGHHTRQARHHPESHLPLPALIDSFFRSYACQLIREWRVLKKMSSLTKITNRNQYLLIFKIDSKYFIGFVILHKYVDIFFFSLTIP